MLEHRGSNAFGLINALEIAHDLEAGVLFCLNSKEAAGVDTLSYCFTGTFVRFEIGRLGYIANRRNLYYSDRGKIAEPRRLMERPRRD